MFVTSHVASIERALRILVGLVFLALALAGPRTIWGLLGVFPLLTGVTGQCPLYALLGNMAHTSHQRHAH